MCQLLALTSNAPTSVTFSFTGFSARGGRTADHVDGFGLAFHDGGACRHFVDDQPASVSVLADFLRHHPIRSRTILAHIRRATQGPVHLANCHPFVREWQGRQWSFAHNGDLKGFRPRLGGRYLPVGQTDSEHAFCWMLQELRRRFPSSRRADWSRVAPVIAELADQAGRHGVFNFLLSDGECVVAYAASSLYRLRREHPFPTAHLVDQDLALDLALDNRAGDRMMVVATEPLTRNEAWERFAPGEMRVYLHGEEIWQRVPAPAAAPLAERPAMPVCAVLPVAPAGAALAA